MTRLCLSQATRERLVESGLDVVITGASGWLGLATLEMLESTLGPEFSSRVHAFASTARVLSLRSGAHLKVHPLDELPSIKLGPHLLAHYAFSTREFISQLGTAEYVSRNQEITSLVADHLAAGAAQGVVVLSSGAVYLGDDLEANPYGVLKARDEEVFMNLANELANSTNIRLVIPRLFNLAGPFLNKPDRYVLGSVIEDVLRGGPIRLSAARPVFRSYVHVADLVDLCFAILLGDGPVPDGPLDTAGEREVEVGELAEIVARTLGRPDIPIERPPIDPTNPDRYVGDGTMMHNLARDFGLKLKDLVQQIEDTARFMGA
jgi:UDP-glucuronate decarboxylase